MEYVETIDPSAIYGGREYDNVLHIRVKEIKQDPKFIIYTIAAKTGVLIWMLVVVINVGLAAAIIRPKSMGVRGRILVRDGFGRPARSGEPFHSLNTSSG